MADAMMAPVRVLQVIGSLGMGGAETWLMEVLRRASRNRTLQIDFLLTSGTRGIFDDEARALGATLHYVRYGRRTLGAFVHAFRRILVESRYHAIHDHADYVSGWHFLMGAHALPPVRVTHVHNPWLHIAANYAISPARRLATAAGKQLVGMLATHVCGTSREILRQYGFATAHGNRGPDVSVVHCGIDVAKFSAPRDTDRRSVLSEFEWPADAKVVLFAGRLDRALQKDDPQNHKNSWFALNIARAAIEKDRTVRLLMAGDGPSRDALVQHVREWRLDDRMRLVGIRDDMPRLMRAADVLLFPSRQEGLGMVAVEAQAAGLPVVASTAVPRECVVIPELYDALPLDASLGLWAERVIRSAVRRRPSLDDCRRAVEASEFSIDTSARHLERIYAGG